MRIIGEKDGMQLLSCDYCQTKHKAPPHKGLAHLYKVEKVRYPHVNGSLGAVVNNRDEENHLAKQMGMVPTDHQRVKVQKRTFRNKTTKSKPSKQCR